MYKIVYSCSSKSKGLALRITVCSYPKVAISKHFSVNKTQTLIEAQSLIEPVNCHFWVGAVIGRFLLLINSGLIFFLSPAENNQ